MWPTWPSSCTRRRPGQQLDGVFYMDPYALASLLELTGPVTLKDSDTKLTSKDAAHTLLVDQYAPVPEGRARRLSRRSDARDVRETHDRRPTEAGEGREGDESDGGAGPVFGHSTHPEIEALFQELALDGAVPSRTTATTSRSRNRTRTPARSMPTSARRDVQRDLLAGHGTGRQRSPHSLDELGPGRRPSRRRDRQRPGQPSGTNHLFLTVYTPLTATGATINDAPTGIGSVRRFGLSAYSIVVDVPPGGTVTVHLKLSGVVARSRQYQLTVVRQPTVNLDHIDSPSRARGGGGWRLSRLPTDGRHRQGQIGAERSEILTATGQWVGCDTPSGSGHAHLIGHTVAAFRFQIHRPRRGKRHDAASGVRFRGPLWGSVGRAAASAQIVLRARGPTTTTRLRARRSFWPAPR